MLLSPGARIATPHTT